MINGDTVSIYRFPSRADIEVQVNSTIQTASEERLKYSYSISSTLGSKLNVNDFKILTPHEPEFLEFPDGWNTLVGGINPGVSWYAKDTLAVLKPGNSLKGLSFQTQRLPTITKYLAWGRTSIPRLSFEPDSLENSSVSKDGKKGLTVGPGITPDEIAPDTLITYLNRSCTEPGWITDQGICHSLEAKLESVDRQLEQGNTNTASGALQAFLNEVEAQKDKQLSSEAYTLLYFNGQYLLEQIN